MTFTQEEERLFDEKFKYLGEGQWVIDYLAFFDPENEDKQTGFSRGYAVPNEFKSFIRAHDQRLLERIREGASEKKGWATIDGERYLKVSDLLTFLKEMEK